LGGGKKENMFPSRCTCPERGGGKAEGKEEKRRKWRPDYSHDAQLV